ncbi:methyltransferase [Porphyromonas levii]|uniref:methyltransferase n=1 Tax=Porphyromonas levii TaxID=28114 RepID=UPI002010C7B4|nr:methyltransferase [Porphyromonas levii]MBR8758983.1 hypothetical protein [Porphyromonas levii]
MEENKNIMMKPILDACCGSRMFYFDKECEFVLYQDIREVEETLCDGRKLRIAPDVIVDFRSMPYEDSSFHLVIFDPPHLQKVGGKSWLAIKYGKLDENWIDTIKRGFDECWRVLANQGTLIFKWNEREIPLREIIKVIGRQPLLGHTTKSGGYTVWMVFYKSKEE